MAYIDGFVIAVPAAKKQEYIESGATFSKLMKEFGATRIVDCWGDDTPSGAVVRWADRVGSGNRAVGTGPPHQADHAPEGASAGHIQSLEHVGGRERPAGGARQHGVHGLEHRAQIE